MEQSKIIRIDVLSIGLFGLAVGALTLGLIQVGYIPEPDSIAVSIICLVFGGLVQILAGAIDVRHHDQLGGTALTMYGYFWTTVFTIKILNLSQGFHWDEILFLPIVVIYCLFSAVMIYLTAHKNLTLMLLHVVITMTFSFDIYLKLGYDLHFFVGIGHLAIGSIAFYHAAATLVNRFTKEEKLPLGSALLGLKND